MEEKKSGIKKFFEEFKAFAMRGNVLDMAVGVVIGGAFTAIVTALVEDIINPLIGLFFKADFSEVVIGLGGSSIKIGEFVNSIINFLIVAFVLFVVIKFVNSLHKKPEEPAEPEEPTTKVCPYCQSEISIKAVRCPHCTSKLQYQDRRVRQLHHQLPHRCLCAVRCDQVCQLPAQKACRAGEAGRAHHQGVPLLPERNFHQGCALPPLHLQAGGLSRNEGLKLSALTIQQNPPCRAQSLRLRQGGFCTFCGLVVEKWNRK